MQELQETWFDPWVGKTPGGGHGNPLQYSGGGRLGSQQHPALSDPMDCSRPPPPRVTEQGTWQQLRVILSTKCDNMLKCFESSID